MEQAKIRPSVTLYSLDRSLPNLRWLITLATPTQKPFVNASARVMAQNTWNQPRICHLGVLLKMVTPPPVAQNSENFALQKPFFAQNTHKSCSKRHENCCQIGNSSWGFQILRDLKCRDKFYFGSSLMAVSAHVHWYGQNVSQDAQLSQRHQK